MATALDFPGNCTTNVYTLNDFGEIAYIVCTVANPPNQDHSVFSNTPENILARLRRTERQFRDASILAALDIEALQLFTFYKKVDIANAKDQKTLLSKFGFVLRSNTCTIAYKTAARLPDLMKPDQSRLYRLFTTAIISSLKISPSNECELQSLGPNLYLAEHMSSGSDVHEFNSLSKWILHRVDLQVIPSGHIILTIARDHDLSFMRLTDALSHGGLSARTARSMPLYLAPVGIIARLDTSCLMDLDSPMEDCVQSPGDESSTARKEVWKEMLPLWLKDRINFAADLKDSLWIEVQVPVRGDDAQAEEGSQDSSSEPVIFESISWRTVFWPAKLCFLQHTKQESFQESTDEIDDPLQFVQTWINGTVEVSATNTSQTQQNMFEDEDEPLFAEDGTFDDPEHFQPFGPPAFPASQTIYPTPPDALMTHATPGLSVDGIPVTPANGHHHNATTQSGQDEEMPDFDVSHTSGTGAGYYDEDLFDEMPDDNFGQEGNGDEPNWDFFDDPGMDTKDASTGVQRQLNDVSMTGNNGNDVGDHNYKAAEDIEMSPTDQRTKPEQVATSATGESTVDTLKKLDLPSQATIIPETDSQATQMAPPTSPKQQIIFEEPMPKGSPQSNNDRRRSSVYDGLQSVAITSDRDSRYASDGTYWFDPSPTTTNPKTALKQSAIYQMMPGSPSGSDDSSLSSYPMSLDHGSANNWAASGLSRQWTEYHVESPAGNDLHNDDDKAAIKQEIQQFLNSLPNGLKTPPLATDFAVSKRVREIPVMSNQKFLQVAHILVEQVSQTSLIPHAEHLDHQAIPDDQLDVHADLSGINTSASSSSLYQLVNLRSESNQSRPHGRITKLASPQVHVRRAEQPLTASTSILGFWDILNLQPENGAKDVTAFCIHPDARTVVDGCSNFLQRMKDAYSACALGAHSTGNIAGLTKTGLLAWNLNESHQANLRSMSKRLGSALAAASDLKGMIVVYMISKSDRMTDYLETCYAFHTLFESFVQATTDKKNVTDIALQIIPMSFVADSETLVIPAQGAYLKLALEVYNRVPPPQSEAAPPPGICASAASIAMTEASVHFRLTTEVSSPLFQHGSCLHVAYSTSDDGRWITAAWTDACGKLGLTMSYCTQIWSSSPKRQRQDIFKEIWEISHDLIGKAQSTWRLCVAKTDVFDSEELDEWREATEGSSSNKKKCVLVLLSVRIYSMLKMVPPPGLGRTGGPNMYGTPASTPQAGGITSPDQLVPATPTPGGSGIVNAPTPPEHGYDPNADSDLTLMDPAEESWSIVLPYGINQTTNMVELRPSTLTGLLMKRKGVKGEDGHTSIEVSLFQSIQPNPPVDEPWTDELLEDIIRQYRGLVTLSVTRGCIRPNLDCLPWHIATAKRGACVLGQVM
ncbi:hypothetical protein LTR84_012383 [Exophiala bonariae]|uniref:Mediator of RNA polymerase II transcription subunit 13 n=1 Tax=Exophiala bonariae TaxID=1690606 RepID=A0AAV9NGH1_9EURO|nr:hypothetical protein LTR84_012383 [Exophiala bonariae]